MVARFHSTRSIKDPVDAQEAVLKGLAPDGGLYVSDEVLQEPLELASLGLSANAPLRYQDHARRIIGQLLPAYGPKEMATMVDEAYGKNFDDSAIAPITPFGDDWRLELFHGPTCAFKDIALQMLPKLMARALAAKAPGERLCVLTATSGDTGKAALAGFANVAHTAIVVLYPAGKVSDIQKLQMVTQPGANVEVVAVRGTFDDAQSAAKAVFANTALASRLAACHLHLSSANSINVGRLVPQVVYYVTAWCGLARAGHIGPQEPVDFFVPTGNFGDILAGYLAKRLGLPVGRLVICSNANDVLVDFLRSGVYDRRRDFKQSISPSMDILVSSNLERLLYFESQGDVELVAALMNDLATKGHYRVPEPLMARIRETFDAGSANDELTRAAIGAAWQEQGLVIDPHTAVGAHVMAAKEPQGRQRVLLSTASPYKFAAEVLRSLGEEPPASGFAAMDRLAHLTHTTPPAPLAALKGAPVRFSQEIDPGAAARFVEAAAKELLP